MPSFEHEVLVQLVREHPELVLDLVGEGLGLPHGATEVVADSENLSALVPVELRADSVVLVRGAAGVVVAVLIVEVQLDTDPDKRFSWPAYLGVARARWRCPVSVIVITTSARVARWAAKPVALSPTGAVFVAHVIGPDGVPLAEPGLARRHPELAVLSLLAHRDAPEALPLGRAILGACRTLDHDRAALYTDVVFSFLNRAARTALEDEMNLEKYEFRSEFMRNLQARAIQEGREEGREEGRQEGREEGREEGRAALARALIHVLVGRGFELEPRHHALISASTDLAQLDGWLVRALGATELDAVFAED